MSEKQWVYVKEEAGRWFGPVSERDVPDRCWEAHVLHEPTIDVLGADCHRGLNDITDQTNKVGFLLASTAGDINLLLKYANYADTYTIRNGLSVYRAERGAFDVSVLFDLTFGGVNRSDTRAAILDFLDQTVKLFDQGSSSGVLPAQRDIYGTLVPVHN